MSRDQYSFRKQHIRLRGRGEAESVLSSLQLWTRYSHVHVWLQCVHGLHELPKISLTKSKYRCDIFWVPTKCRSHAHMSLASTQIQDLV